MLALLAVYIAVDAAGVVLSWTGHLPSEPSLLPTMGGEGLLALAGFVGFGSFVALAILFGIWLSRAYDYVAAKQPLATGKGFTVGAWYIPVLGPFLALGPMSRLWRSGPGGSNIAAPWALLYGLAQAVPLLGSIVIALQRFEEIVQAIDTGELPQGFLESARWVDTAGFVLLVGAAVFMAMAVTRFEAWKSAWK
jgi:hypothetical protein